jgi:hypothetical protein
MNMICDQWAAWLNCGFFDVIDIFKGEFVEMGRHCGSVSSSPVFEVGREIFFSFFSFFQIFEFSREKIFSSNYFN